MRSSSNDARRPSARRDAAKARPRGLSRALLCAAVAYAGCAKDEVLRDTVAEATCGNGVVEPGEACDVDAPGCVQCVVAPNWSCDDGGCAQVCGDGVIDGAGGGACASPRRERDCDVSGWWAARETDYTRDSVLGGTQTSSTWYALHLEQAGDDFHVVDEIECGIHVTGSAVVDDTPGTLRALMYANRMDAKSPHGARHGTSKPASSGCAITLDRWYKVRGVDESFLPADFSANPTLGALPALPFVNNIVTDTSTPPGSVDQDSDGIPGVAFGINAFVVTGVRNAAQRDWKEFSTPAGTSVPAGALELTVPGAFDLQENVLRVTGCGNGCALIGSAAHAASDLKGRLTLSFLGKSLGGARVSRVVGRAPREDLQSDLTTCANVRLVLPHDGSTPR